MIDPPPWSDDDILETPPCVRRVRSVLTRLAAPVRSVLAARRERLLARRASDTVLIQMIITSLHPRKAPPDDPPQQL